MLTPKTPAFTLIELIITIALVGILSMISLSTFAHFTQRSNLEHSDQLLESTLQSHFSSARSKPEIFGILGHKDDNFVYEFSCEKVDCSDRSVIANLPKVNLEKGIKIKNPDYFDIRFYPPHGDVKFFDNAGDEIADEVLTLEIENKNGQNKTVTIYRKSGFID